MTGLHETQKTGHPGGTRIVPDARPNGGTFLQPRCTPSALATHPTDDPSRARSGGSMRSPVGPRPSQRLPDPTARDGGGRGGGQRPAGPGDGGALRLAASAELGKRTEALEDLAVEMYAGALDARQSRRTSSQRVCPPPENPGRIGLDRARDDELLVLALMQLGRRTGIGIGVIVAA